MRTLSSKKDGDVAVGRTVPDPILRASRSTPWLKTAQLPLTGPTDPTIGAYRANHNGQTCPACHLIHPVTLLLFDCLNS